MSESAARLADVLYGVYQSYAVRIGVPAPPGLAAADQIVQKVVKLLATTADTMLRTLAEKGRI